MLGPFVAAALVAVAAGQARKIILDVDGSIDDARSVVLAFNFDPKVGRTI